MLARSIPLVLLLLCCAPAAIAQSESENDFDAAVAALDSSGFPAKGRAIEALAATGDPRAPAILQALLDGDLYARRGDDRVVFATRSGGGYALRDAVSGEALGEVGRRGASRIAVNNALRIQLRTALARLNLQHPDPAVRRTAARRMIDSFDADTLPLLREAAEQETDPGIRELIETALALGGLASPEPADRIAAIESLSGRLSTEVRNRLSDLVRDEDDPAVREAALAAIDAIERQRAFYRQVETVFFGLSLGSVLLLAAIGLAITFGVMGVINMAHGELIMIGAYTTYIVQQLMPGLLDWSLLVAVPAAFLVAGAFGVAIERGVIRFLYGRPLETLLATFGISLILQQLVRTTISAQNVPVANPGWMSGSWQINEALSLTWNRLFIIVFALAVFAALVLVLKRTSLGLKMRAVTQNRDMARAMGVRSDRVDALTFGLGAGIAGIAGVALSQLTNVGPNLGQNYIIDSFLVVVFGGVGNLWGTLVGAFSLGVINKFLEPWSGAVLAKILVLVFIILFIQKRPRGLFPQKGRAAAGA